jgi:hypothetical protein
MTAQAQTIFEEPVNAGIAEAPLTDAQKDYLSDLVGEGKKFKTPQDLARGKIEADNFIERLKTENAKVREELNTRIKLEEVMDRITNVAAPLAAPSNQAHAADEQARAPAPLTEEQISKMMDAELTKRETLNAQTQNLNQVKNRLRSVYGDNFASKMKDKATELGLGPEFLNDIASKNPKAFFKLVGVSEVPQQDRNNLFASPPRSDISGESFAPQNTERTKAYYDKIQKDMGTGKFYADIRIQNQMHEDSQRLGERFYD